MILDTPGQIEIFTWSASGAIITDAVASSLPTVVAYIIDTPRTTAPATFMSNMLYACRCVPCSTYDFLEMLSHQSRRARVVCCRAWKCTNSCCISFTLSPALLSELRCADRFL